MSNPTIEKRVSYTVNQSTGQFTVQGAAFKSLILILCACAGFIYAWDYTTRDYHQAYTTPTVDGSLPTSIDLPQQIVTLALSGIVIGFVLAMVIVFNPGFSPVLAPIYAVIEGLILGAISAGVEAKYPGVPLQAATGTIATSFGMLCVYMTGILRPTQRFQTGLLAALVGILALSFVDLGMQMYGSYIPVVHSSGPWGIALQVVIVIVAACCLINDFGLITESAEFGAPKWYEWYAGFSLLVTLIWLYAEMLKLFMKLKNED